MKKSSPKIQTKAVSVIVTVFNEAKTINRLLKALAKQTYKPTEIIIVDGGSTDQTWKKLQSWSHRLPQLKIFYQEGNRAVGRNLAIKEARSKLVAITDAGCVPQSDWLEKLVKKYQKTNISVIAGYYRGVGRTSLESAIIPYVLVMPDKVDENNFLPATRSMLLTKKVWQNVAGFNEKLDSSEDYDFALKLERAGVKIVFARDALVQWWPRTNLTDFAIMILEFAFWDIKAGHLRKKVRLLFLRYLGFFLLLSIYFESHNLYWLLILILVLTVYIFWSITKNKKYVPSGWYWLPILQLLSDFMVMGGSMLALLNRVVDTN